LVPMVFGRLPMVTRYLWKDCFVGNDADVDGARVFSGKREIMLGVATEAM